MAFSQHETRDLQSGFLWTFCGLTGFPLYFFEDFFGEQVFKQLFVFEFVNIFGEILHGYQPNRNDGKVQQ